MAPAKRQPEEGQGSKRTKNAGIKWLEAQREGKRKIKLHDQQQEKAQSKEEAVALTNAGLPDMRLATDVLKFKQDVSKRLDGKDDRRFLENRDDLQEYHESQGDSRPNFIFTDDMLPA